MKGARRSSWKVHSRFPRWKRRPRRTRTRKPRRALEVLDSLCDHRKSRKSFLSRLKRTRCGCDWTICTSRTRSLFVGLSPLSCTISPHTIPSCTSTRDPVCSSSLSVVSMYVPNIYVSIRAVCPMDPIVEQSSVPSFDLHAYRAVYQLLPK